MYPDNFARFYDIIYNQLRNKDDHDFFLEQIRGSKGKVLEIGVGTGRFFIDALHGGADIYGIDISPPMIGILRKKLEESQQFRVSLQDILNFSFDFQFDLITAPFRVMMHVTEKADQLKALNNVYRHLKPGGKFIFDTFVPDLRQLIEGLDNKTDFEGEYKPGKSLKRSVSTTSDLINQLIHVNFNLEWEEEHSIQQELWYLPLRFFFRYELEHLVERSDFDSYTLMGNYNGEGLNADSRDFIVVCIKT